MRQELDLKLQVKQILALIQKVAPGKSVELRIPPYAAIQCVEGGNHRRGTPANVVEMSGETLINLAQDPSKWEDFCHQGLISASGTNSDLSEIFQRVSKLIYSPEGIS